MTARTFWKAGLLALLAALASPSFAYVPNAFAHYGDAGVSLAIANQIQSDIRAQQSASSSASVDDVKAEPDSFRYTPSKARTRANLSQFVSRTRAADPTEADKLQAFFASTDIIGAVDGEMRKIGLRADDVADAYALWWALAWCAVQGRESETDADTFAAVRAQAAHAFEATGKFAGASDAVKQEMAESLIVQAAMADAANDQMRGDPDQRRALATAVNKGARGMGLDLTSMTLTKEGFQPRPRG